jgi:hypothetical protein
LGCAFACPRACSHNRNSLIRIRLHGAHIGAAAAAADAMVHLAINNKRVKEQMTKLDVLKHAIGRLESNSEDGESAGQRTLHLASICRLIRSLCTHLPTAMACCRHLVPLIAKLISSSEEETAACAAEALWIFALPDEGKDAVVNCTAIPSLLLLMTSSNLACKNAAIGCIRTLSTHEAAVKDLQVSGAVHALISILVNVDNTSSFCEQIMCVIVNFFYAFFL